MADGTPVFTLVVRVVGDSDPLTEAVRRIESSLDEMGKKINDVSESVAHSFDHMKEKLLELGAEFLSFEALKEFASDALEAYAASEKFSISMTQLTGSAEVAEETLAALKNITATQPFALPDLLTSSQRLTAFGIEAEKIPGIMQAAANASAATGNSFDAVASAIGRVELSGTVGARQLVQLGLSWKDIATAMGTSVEEAQSLLKKGGQDAEADVDALLTAVNTKFSGASAALAGSISGQFQVLKNNIELMMEDAGEKLAPLARTLMSFAETDILPFFSELGESFHKLAEAADPLLVGALGGALETLKQLMTVITLAAAGAAELAQDFRMLADASHGLMDAVGLSGLSGTMDKMGAALKIFHDVTLQLLGVLPEFKPVMSDVQKGFESGVSGPLGYSDSLVGLRKSAADATTELERLKNSALKFNPIPLQIITDTKAWQEALSELPGTYDRMAEAAQSGFDWVTRLNNVGTQTPKWLSDANQEAVSWQDIMAKAGVTSQEALDGAAAAAYKAYLQMSHLADIGVTTDANVEKMFDNWYKAELKALGVDESVTTKLKSNWDGVGQHISQSISRDLSKAMSDLLFQVNNVGAAFVKLGQDVVDIILGKIVTAIVGPYIDSLVKLVTGWLTTKAAASLTDVGEVMGNAAVASSAAYASIAAIPIIGPALAPAAAAVAYAEVAAMAPLATFEQGGYVPYDMLAMVHKGEHFTPAGQKDATGGDTYNVTIQVNGAKSPAVIAREIATHLKSLNRTFAVAG